MKDFINSSHKHIVHDASVMNKCTIECDHRVARATLYLNMIAKKAQRFKNSVLTDTAKLLENKLGCQEELTKALNDTRYDYKQR